MPPVRQVENKEEIVSGVLVRELCQERWTSQPVTSYCPSEKRSLGASQESIAGPRQELLGQSGRRGGNVIDLYFSEKRRRIGNCIEQGFKDSGWTGREGNEVMGEGDVEQTNWAWGSWYTDRKFRSVLMY